MTILSCKYADLLGIENAREVLYVLWKYRVKWRFIGLELQIEAGDLEAIGVNNRTVRTFSSRSDQTLASSCNSKTH